MDDYNEWKAEWDRYIVARMFAAKSSEELGGLLDVANAMDEVFHKMHRHDLRLALKDIEEP